MLRVKKKQRVLFILFVVMLSLVGCNKQNSQSLDEFESFYSHIKDNFTYDGYEEIMKDKSVVLALPLEYKKVDEAVDYLVLQKLFVYKNEEKDVIILLQITDSQDTEDSWNHSLTYSPMDFNNPETGAVLDIPEIEMGAYSFTYEGYNYMSIALSGSKQENPYFVTEELLAFNNEFINFITKDMAK